MYTFISNQFRIKLQKLLFLLKKQETKKYYDFNILIFDSVDKKRFNLNEVTVLLTDECKECTRKKYVNEEIEIETDNKNTVKDLLLLLEKYENDYNDYYVSFRSNETKDEYMFSHLELFYNHENTKEFCIMTHKLKKYTLDEYYIYDIICKNIDFFFDSFSENSIKKSINDFRNIQINIDKQRKINIEKDLKELHIK
jgi:hypothetical protein